MKMNIRKATKHDARTLAILINLAGEGIPEHMWRSMADCDQSPIDVGTIRAAREDGGFSYKNAHVCTQGDEILGMIIAYKQPGSYDTGDLGEYPDYIRPLIILEAKAPGSWYVNALATFEAHRGKGVARLLLTGSQRQSLKHGCRTMSLIVSSENHDAYRLYKYIGFNDISREPVVPCPGLMHAGDWILMTRELPEGDLPDPQY